MFASCHRALSKSDGDIGVFEGTFGVGCVIDLNEKRDSLTVMSAVVIRQTRILSSLIVSVSGRTFAT